ncbi:MAG: hypothetical protein AAFU60_04880, partial [Bacteroidota bacterium]
MSIRYFLCCTLLFGGGTSIAQTNPCTPSSPITCGWGDLSKPTLQTLITQHSAIYTEAEVFQLISQLEWCKQDIKSRLTTVRLDREELALQYQQVLAVRDVAGTQQQIADLKKSRAEALMSLEEQLAASPLQGIYAVFLPDINPFTDVKAFQQQALQALTNDAIADINGTNIQRVTEVVNQGDVQDVIRSLSSGTVRVDEILYSNPNYQARYYFYVGLINVSPLLGDLPEKNKATGVGGAQAFNVLQNENAASQLRSLGLSSDDMAQLQARLRANQENVQRSNKIVAAKQLEIIRRSELRIRDIERQITELEQQLTERESKIAQYCQELGVAFKQNDLNGSAQRALESIQEQLEELEARWNNIKGEEILYQEATFDISGNPVEKLAEETLDLVESMKVDYSTQTLNKEVIDLENFEVSQYQNTRQVTLYRTLNRIWVMPVGLANGKFKVYVFSQFRITKEEVEGESMNPVRNDHLVKIDGGRFKMGSNDYGDEK